MVEVNFSVVCETTDIHELLAVTGACPELGSWKRYVYAFMYVCVCMYVRLCMYVCMYVTPVLSWVRGRGM